MPELYERLDRLDNQTRYPFHMPGHKRNPQAGPLADIMRLDITEIDGFDDLHDARGVILEAQKKAARLYGAKESRFLVNGSTAGVLAAVSAVCKEREDGKRPLILAGRASHLSLYHAVYLMDAELDNLWESDAVTEEADGRAALSGVVPPGAVMSALERCAREGRLPAAVFVTSPNYYGVVGDVVSIVEIAHHYGVPVIVDAAHGAHFGFGSGMPDSAVHAGADIVITSVHKTLPSLTQTALIHTTGDLTDTDRLDRFLKIYQTSSPSYILMASIDSCMSLIENRADEIFGRAVVYKQVVLERAAKLKALRVLPETIIKDPCKVVISTADTPMTGFELYDILLENYSLQPEMADMDHVVMILTGMDTEDGLEALLWSLVEIDGYIASGTLSGGEAKRYPVKCTRPERVYNIKRAWDTLNEEIALDEAPGRVAAQMIVPYPPGTPELVPGELIDKDMTERLKALAACGCRIRGLKRDNGYRIKVIKDKAD